MTSRRRNYGLRKVCGCGRGRWPKCPHGWHFSFKPRGGRRHRFSLDVELGRHIETKTEAENEATKIRAAILAGAFRRTTDGLPRPVPPGATLDQLAESYLTAVKGTGKRSVNCDASMLARLCGYQTLGGRRLGAWQTAEISENVLEGFHSEQRAAGRAASTLNHYTTLLKSLFRWAARKGSIAHSPISHESSLRRTKVAQRRRRLSPVEETALLMAAGALTRGAGLHAAEMGLQESMRRFDAARGKPVANDPPKEPLPVGHEEPQTPSKDLLH